MKIAIVMLLLTTAAIAQDQPAAVPAACGPQGMSFNVKRDNSQHTLGQSEPGKAMIYFIQDLGQVSCLGGCIMTRIGMDGTWVGANQRNSYFPIAIEPGEHHLCASAQLTFSPASTALAHFTAEAGKVYYFRNRVSGSRDQSLFDFDSIDGDQAKYLIAS